MAKTPEGKVKAMVSAFLRSVPNLWYNMPVPTGYGAPTLDYLCCYAGHFFAIETKAPDGRLTERQEATIEEMQRAGGKVFVVRNAVDLQAVKDWIAYLALRE